MKGKSRKDIILIITYVSLVIFGLVNFEKIFTLLGEAFNICSPFIIGVIFAFILNVINNFYERKFFGKVKNNSFWKKAKRPISITLSLVSVFVIIIFVIYLLIPQLENSLGLFKVFKQEKKNTLKEKH